MARRKNLPYACRIAETTRCITFMIAIRVNLPRDPTFWKIRVIAILVRVCPRAQARISAVVVSQLVGEQGAKLRHREHGK